MLFSLRLELNVTPSINGSTQLIIKQTAATAATLKREKKDDTERSRGNYYAYERMVPDYLKRECV